METINWNDLYIQLYAYTDQLLKNYTWFRKRKTDSYLKGKQIHDYIADAIEKYLLEPEKYDATSGRSILTYLKWHIIRTTIGNDVRSAENKTTVDTLSGPHSDDDNDDKSYIDKFLPFISAHFDDEIDYKTIIKEIERELENDVTAKLIFEEVRCNGNDRRDVIKEHKISEKDFDNGMKRLKTVLKNIAKQFNYE